ncbi:enoyl-CoA hydratase-related protein [Pseudorhodoplanes sp.]|uniref:enoyl-CoA hydratase-related protein n=1 Tax=Pseudorhodoplanes sp. TaxID=1934341 RepID=UPI0039C9A3A7
MDAHWAASLAHCAKSTLAVVEGVAAGGGPEVAVCCDFILASERARFGLPDVKASVGRCRSCRRRQIIS